MKKIFGLAVIIIFLGVLCLILIGSRDIPPPDTSDLILERTELPPEQNAFTYFSTATNSFYWPTNFQVIVDYLDGKPVDDSFIREIIARNTDMIAAIEKGLACTECSVPEVTRFDAKVPYISLLRNMGRLLAVKTQHERLSEKHAKAMRTCVSLLQFGYLVQGDSETLIQYLVGIAIMGSGFEQAQALARNEATPQTDLLTLSQELARLVSFDSGLVRATKAEYRAMVSIFDGIADGTLGKETLTGTAHGILGSILGQKRIPRYFFHPNRTKAMFADIYRRVIDNAPRPYAAMDLRTDKTPLMKPSAFSLLTHPNAIGRVLYQVLSPNRDSILERKCRTEFSVGATRVLAAINAYRQEEGKLPGDLQALVPEFLPSIPIDPYDGKPFRYSASKGIIYSVGKDLKDSGGSLTLPDNARSEIWETEDIVLDVGLPANGSVK